ncbi:hypothetical protein Bca101_051539 [Brassica carinata]
MLEFDFRLRSTASRWTKGGVKFLAPSAKKHQRTVSSFTCVHCNNTNVVGVLDIRENRLQEKLQVVPTVRSLQLEQLPKWPRKHGWHRLR